MNEEINNIKTNEEMTEDDTQIVSQTDCEDFAYTILENGIRIDAYMARSEDIKILPKVIIPDTIENLPIIEIGEQAFVESNVHSVNIPDSVTSIGYMAFEG